MKRPATSRRLVVDTNVARSASESEHPVSDACRRVLETIRDEKHQIVLSATQYREWQNHRSKFTRGWLLEMVSRKQIWPLKPEPDSGITDRIYALECTANQRQELLKDVHLLENALATDHVVLSQETNVFRLFCTHTNALRIARPVAWVHPVENPVACMAWLEAGADVATAQPVVPAGV